ncbi:hypothetical protein [Vibrio sp. F13]|nr:hypothetical protein [Vibrio sp. F13]
MSGFKDGYEPTQDDLDSYSRQLDPENDTYWQSRGYGERVALPILAAP